MASGLIVALPASQVTCPAFVDAGGEGMLVTSGFWTREDDAREGRTFLIATGFRGVLDPAYRAA